MSILKILPRFRHFCCVMELRGGTLIVALCGLMFGISRFLQLVGVEKSSGNDFGISGDPADIAKVDTVIMIDGIILLIFHVFLIIGTCYKCVVIIQFYVILSLINLIVMFMTTLIWISTIDATFAFALVMIEVFVLYLVFCINSYQLKLTEDTSDHE